MTAPLHIPSLSIQGFRGISSLELPRLGRVTLLAGENGVGKTTVLDACRFYAARGDGRVLVELLEGREEYIAGIDEDGDSVSVVDLGSLFHNPEGVREPTPIHISANSGDLELSARFSAPDEDNLEFPPLDHDELRVLKVFLGNHSRTVDADYYAARYARTGRRLPVRSRRLPRGSSPAENGEPWPPPIPCESLGPGLLDNDDLARLWDAVTLTDGEELAIDALRLVVGDDLERLNVVGDHTRYGRSVGRRAVARLASHPVPVPVKRLGDGANRLLAIALALANARDGILLIDEAENGIHYAIQPDLWRMVFRAAEAAKVQVIAATHSWDCIAGFAKAAVESDADGSLFRLERGSDGLHSVPYSEENLEVAARQGTEVR